MGCRVSIYLLDKYLELYYIIPPFNPLILALFLFRLGVMNFPQKAKKAPPRKEVTLVCVIHASAGDRDEYLLAKRPPNG